MLRIETVTAQSAGFDAAAVACSDYEGKRGGGEGRSISGDIEQYPSRTSLTGGFAGGEAGLQQFIEGGEIKFKDPNDGKQAAQVTQLDTAYHTISCTQPHNRCRI